MAIENVEEMKIVQHGTVTIGPDEIAVSGFEGHKTTCRELSIMAYAWAIGELQREMLKSIVAPGAGNIYVE